MKTGHSVNWRRPGALITVGTILSGTVLMAAAMLLPVQKAYASGCWASGCLGHDPVKEGCIATSSKPFTIKDSSGNVLATGNNIYSSGCDANWAQVYLSNYSLSHTFPQWGVTIGVHTTDGTGEIACFDGSNTGNTGKNEYCGWSGNWSYAYTPQWGWPAYSDMFDGTSVVCVDAYVLLKLPPGVNCASRQASCFGPGAHLAQ